MSTEFCHLHTHTQYSLLDGASRIKDVIARAMQMGQSALAITDHGNMFGAIEFYNACKEATQKAEKEGRQGLKPILGMEAYLVPNGESRTKREKVHGEYDYHCLLWAADAEGFRNLMKLSTYAYTEGFYNHPRVDRELLAKYGKGILASSGCLGSEIPQTLLKQDYAAAQKVAGAFLELFGKDNFYFELQNQTGALASLPGEDAQNLAREQKQVNAAVVKLARELGGKLIATNDSHYTTREDARAHDALLCIGTGKLITDTNRMRFACDEFYLKSSQEMQRLFPDLPEALSNTLEVAERCDVKLKFGAYHYPVFPIPGGEDPEVFFRRTVEAGLQGRYGVLVPAEVKARVEEELRVIQKMGFNGYLLIVWDIIREARGRGIPVGPGRGSAAGSLVCYALGITDLDPLKYQLLFERFVNEGRNEMPDIDIDFCQSRRSEIIEYVQNKYGRDHTAGIITFNSMAAKGAIRDLGRVMEWPLSEVDRVAKLIPSAPGKRVTLQARTDKNDDGFFAIDDEPELKAAYESDAKTRNLIDYARRIEGLARNPGRHAAGLVIADRPVIEYCPLYKDKDGALLTQFEMAHLDSVGLLKIDFLGLQTLTELALACRIIKERHGRVLDLGKIPLDDMPTYRMLHRGEAKGVFQFESDGMVRLLMEARPDCLEDLTALNAMYRPGPMDNIPSFIHRKHGREPIHYLVPQLEPILKETYGIIVYQEQVMQIANSLADFTLSEADALRKAMGKKKRELMEKYGAQFVAGCAKNKIPQDKARALYELIAKFAEYGFNKSHAAAYALVAYQTAWLKSNYTAEYMAALLSLRQGNTDDLVAYSDEARRIGLELAGPDVNSSGVHFQIEPDGKTLRFSLGALKGVGEKAVEAIAAARKKDGVFKDLYDFCTRVDARAANKTCLESLIKAGAFDALASDGGRGQLSAALEEAMHHGANLRRDLDSGQGSLFGGDDLGDAMRPPLPKVADWPQAQRLEEEKKILGFYFSGHPLADVREIVEGLSSRKIRELDQVGDGMEVVTGAYVTALRATVTRERSEKMAVLSVEDFSGTTQIVVFPRTYERYKDLLKPDVVLFFRSKLKKDERGLSLAAEEVFTLDDAVQRYASALTITINDKSEPQNSKSELFSNRLESLVQLLQANSGSVQVWFQLDLKEGQSAPTSVTVKAGSRLCVKPTTALFAGLHDRLPRGAVRVIGENNQPRRPAEPPWKRRSSGPA